MKRFISYVDNCINNLLISNKEINDRLLSLSSLNNKLKSPGDLINLDNNLLNNLLDYLVMEDLAYVKDRVNDIKLNVSDSKNIIYLNNLFKEIKQRLYLLMENLEYKLKNNNELIERYYFIYSAFSNDILADQIVDFDLINKILIEMGADEDYKKMIINEISENNVKIQKNKMIKNMQYYLDIDEYDLYSQYINLVEKKKRLLKKQISFNFGDVDYNCYELCMKKLFDIETILNELNIVINLFNDTKNVEERKILINEKSSYFAKLEKGLEEYSDLEDEFLLSFDYDKIDDNVTENVNVPNIIYLTKGHNGTGNSVFHDYMKGIPKEYYSRLLKMLNDMENYSQYENLATNKVLTGVLKGLWEKKAFKVRIYYKKLANNDVLILFCDMKKSYDTQAKDRYADMLKNWEDEIKYIEDVMSVEGKKKNELININKQIHEGIKNELRIGGRSL